jgi:hypothetical protein
MRNGKQLLRLLGQPDDFSRDLLRWDSIYLRPASPISSKVFGEILEFLRNVRPMEVNLLQPGYSANRQLAVPAWAFGSK